MELCVTRDSVAMGDDINCPHEKRFSFSDPTSIEEALDKIVTSGYLPKIHGGRATWSVVSGFPISVIAQQWEKPLSVGWPPVKVVDLQLKDGMVGLHFNYHAQVEPEIVLEVLKKLKLNAF